MNEAPIKNFELTLYGDLEKINVVFSRGRCRIFYKGANRNRTFITEEFAEKLISTIDYIPVKGIYDDESQDYTDHGEKRTLGRIYGVVPKECNFAWEKHLDEDGVEREYACVDVILYTGIYKEAGEILGKSQSMELYAPSIQGSWKLINGQKYYEYTDACFLGLQVLGDDVEPCFEGSAFYTLYPELLDYFRKISKDSGKGGQKMPNDLFRLSDRQKECAISELLNSEVDEEGYKIYRYAVTAVYDEYALAYDFVDGTYERIYYTKNDETDTIEFAKRCKAYVIDVNETEYTALKAFRQLNGDTFEKADEVFGSINSLKEDLSKSVSEYESLANDNNSLKNERDSANALVEESNANYAAAQGEIEQLKAERDELASYKKNVEDSKKLAVIDTYSEFLSDEVLNDYRENLDSYTIEDLDMKLTYQQKLTCPETFNKNSAHAPIPKNDEDMGGIKTILARYERK